VFIPAGGNQVRKGLVFGLIALGLTGFAGSALAGLPCAGYSHCGLDVIKISGCATTDLIWCPAGDKDLIRICVTVRDCLEAPVDSCIVRLDLLNFKFDPGDHLGAGVFGRICGTGTYMGNTLNNNGVYCWTLTGGGAGTIMFDWSVTAECADPEVLLCAESDTLCTKSFDFNGSGNVNFFDTFKYLPCLNSGVGYYCDFAQCNATNFVNFFDTFQYLPHLNGSHTCLPAVVVATNVELPWDCDDIY
jgi:hypothetical protein